MESSPGIAFSGYAEKYSEGWALLFMDSDLVLKEIRFSPVKIETKPPGFKAFDGIKAGIKGVKGDLL